MRNSCRKSRFKSKTTSKQLIFRQCALNCYFGGTNNGSWCKSISQKCWRQCLWFLSGNISIFWHWSDCSTNLFSIVFKLGLNQSQLLLSIHHIWHKLFWNATDEIKRFTYKYTNILNNNQNPQYCNGGDLADYLNGNFLFSTIHIISSTADLVS